MNPIGPELNWRCALDVARDLSLIPTSMLGSRGRGRYGGRSKRVRQGKAKVSLLLPTADARWSNNK